MPTFSEMTRPQRQHDRAFQQARAKFKQKCKDRRSPCARCCGELGPIDYDCEPQLSRAFELGHIKDFAVRPDLFNVESNWQPEHSICNRRAQAKAKKAKRQQEQRPVASVDRWVKPTF
jgi:hypothetical protein